MDERSGVESNERRKFLRKAMYQVPAVSTMVMVPLNASFGSAGCGVTLCAGAEVDYNDIDIWVDVDTNRDLGFDVETEVNEFLSANIGRRF